MSFHSCVAIFPVFFEPRVLAQQTRWSYNKIPIIIISILHYSAQHMYPIEATLAALTTNTHSHRFIFWNLCIYSRLFCTQRHSHTHMLTIWRPEDGRYCRTGDQSTPQNEIESKKYHPFLHSVNERVCVCVEYGHLYKYIYLIRSFPLCYTFHLLVYVLVFFFASFFSSLSSSPFFLWTTLSHISYSQLTETTGSIPLVRTKIPFRLTVRWIGGQQKKKSDHFSKLAWFELKGKRTSCKCWNYHGHN